VEKYLVLGYMNGVSTM